MRITDILDSACVKVPLIAQDKESAIYELVDLLADHQDISDAQALKTAVWNRETTRTTGIGHGIGIPHGKAAGCDQLRMAVGVADPPIEFGSIDGKPVSLIFLLASPPDQTGPHIQALASISRMLTEDELRQAMQQARNAEALYHMIESHEQQAAQA